MAEGGREEGVTLMELMIVVAIIGVLATIAVFMFTRHARKARASEVPLIFGELRLREQAFHLEHDTYLGTGADESDTFPATVAGEDAQTFDITASPAPPAAQAALYPGASWVSLKMKPQKSELYCAYVAITGAGGDDTNVGSIAAGDPFDLGSATRPVPATDWYYLLAQCDFNGNGTNSTYFTLSDTEGRLVLNEGE